jgi:hypothetical protein
MTHNRRTFVSARNIHLLCLTIASTVAIAAITTTSAVAQCTKSSATVSGRNNISFAFGTGFNDSIGVKAAAPEAQEVCRGALGASSTNFVRHANVASATFYSPGNNTFCYLLGTQRICVNAKAHGNPPHINSLNCFCIPVQCADGVDNDGDGAADLADFSCGGNPTNNNESSPAAQCQDGADNDGDGAVDLADFSCGGNRQKNDEANPKAQCQDGLDNDSDGAVDTNDSSCGGNKQKNDEANPKAQCQDGSDNDGDGAIDLADFSCGGDKQKNDESNPKTQCQDGVDNDGDGATDLADFSCGGDRQKNDESTPKAQCQDGLDNDSDGAIDTADFSCGGNKQKNDESTPKSQCQDGLDNDRNNLIDLNDPGCTNAQDNDESGTSSIIAIATECVLENADGSYSAYFSYVNPTSKDIVGGFDSSFDTGASAIRSPTAFKSGACRGCASANFTGSSITWTVQGSGVGRATTTASTTSPKCSDVTPTFSCKGFKAGKLRVKAGWSNPNGFSVYYPVGALNNFSPGKADIGQPTEFLSGTVPAAFDVVLDTGVNSTTWKLNSKSVSSGSNTPVCSGECVDTPTGTITGNLNDIAQQLADTTRKAAQLLESIAPEDAVDAERAREAAAGYVQTAQSLTLQFPAVIKNCPEAPQFCSTVDRGPTIESLKGLYATARNTVKRVVSRAYFRKNSSTNRKDPLIKKALSLEKQGLAELAKLPRFATECK